MQRLFSTFPASWPGVGLLVLRLALAASVLAILPDGAAVGWLSTRMLVACASGVVAACTAGGFATPVTSPLLVVCALALRDVPAPTLVLTAGAGLSLSLIGPGAWSVDAWLYGRKRIRFDD